MDHALDEKEQQQLISGNYAGLNCVYIYAEVLNYLESVFKEHLPNALPKGLNGRDDKAGTLCVTRTRTGVLLTACHRVDEQV